MKHTTNIIKNYKMEIKIQNIHNVIRNILKDAC